MLIRSEVIQWFRDLFPDETVYDVSYKGEDIVVKIAWPDSAGEQPSSKRINLRISKEAIDDYLMRDDYRNSARELLRDFIRSKLSKGERPPKKRAEETIDTWNVTTNMFVTL